MRLPPTTTRPPRCPPPALRDESLSGLDLFTRVINTGVDALAAVDGGETLLALNDALFATRDWWSPRPADPRPRSHESQTRE